MVELLRGSAKRVFDRGWGVSAEALRAKRRDAESAAEPDCRKTKKS